MKSLKERQAAREARQTENAAAEAANANVVIETTNLRVAQSLADGGAHEATTAAIVAAANKSRAANPFGGKSAKK